MATASYAASAAGLSVAALFPSQPEFGERRVSGPRLGGNGREVRLSFRFVPGLDLRQRRHEAVARLGGLLLLPPHPAAITRGDHDDQHAGTDDVGREAIPDRLQLRPAELLIDLADELFGLALVVGHLVQDVRQEFHVSAPPKEPAKRRGPYSLCHGEATKVRIAPVQGFFDW